MVSKRELQEWVNRLDDSDFVGVDEGGLTLVTEDGRASYEVGGIPEEEDDEDDAD